MAEKSEIIGAHQEIAALLDWYRSMGADEAIGDAPLNAFAVEQFADPVAAAEYAPPSPAPARRREDAPSVKHAVRPAPAAEEAARLSLEDIAGKAKTLAELEALAAAFDGCSLKRTAKNICFARGAADAQVMIIGEAPGRDEDMQGRPFVGRAGQLLDKMLGAIGLDESSVYITNTVYWRPPGNRTPTAEEIEACAPFLAWQIELLRPKLLVLLGGAAASSMLKRSDGIMRLRGKWLSYSTRSGELPVLATLHPAFLLRKPQFKRQAWQDLLAIKARLAAE